MNSSSLKVAKGNRFERRKQRTRYDLVVAATRVLANKGLQATKITDIAAAADVGVGTFYLHFETKDALYDALVEDAAQRLKAAVDAAREGIDDPVAETRAATAAMCRFARDNREVFKLVFGPAVSHHDVVRRAQAEFARDIEQTIRRGGDRGAGAGRHVDAAPGVVERARSGTGRVAERDDRHAHPAGPESPLTRRRIAPMYEGAVGNTPTHDEREQQIELLSTTFNTAYAWNYEMVRRELHNLYEKAKRDQWNATTQLAWHLDVDAEAENLPDMQIPVYGTHIWEKLGPAEIRLLRKEQLRWSLSNFMHGEQGALLATAQIVDATPWMEAKFYGATQVMDEARHVEVFSRYLNEKLGGPYRINANLKALIDQILTDSRWDMKYLGMQIMVEGLAMAAFGFMHKL